MSPYSKNLFFSSVNYLSISLSVCLCLSARLSMYLSLQLAININWTSCYLRKSRLWKWKKKLIKFNHAKIPHSSVHAYVSHRQAGQLVCSKADFEDQNSSKFHIDLKDHKVLRELSFLIKASTTPSLHAPWAALKEQWDLYISNSSPLAQINFYLSCVPKFWALLILYFILHIFFKLIESNGIRRNWLVAALIL